MTQKWLRWLPAALVPAVIAGFTLAGGVQASADTGLPTRSVAEVLSLATHNTVRQFSGTVEQSSKLGLPELPSTGPSAQIASGLELLSGTHTVRIYADGPQKLRLQVLDPLAERELVRNGTSVWGYNYRDNSAAEWTLPASAPAGDVRVPAVSPSDLARKFLAAADSTTAVTLGPQRSIAGRNAYELVLTPRSVDTLVGSVAVDVDGATGLPLAVTVTARGQQDPALRVAFDSLTLAEPDANLFLFAPPAGATVQRNSVPAPPAHAVEPGQRTPFAVGQEPGASAGHAPAALPNGVHLGGTGWGSVIELPAGMLPAPALDFPGLAQAMTAVQGGRALSTSLVTVFFANDGRIFAGAVPLPVLQAAAAGK